MVNRFLSTFGALAVCALLVGFGGATPVAKVKIPAKAISEIPITHHFSQFVGQAGSIISGSPPPLIATMPADVGVAIAQITLDSLATVALVVKVNGNPVFRVAPSFGSVYATASFTIAPPLIVPPGSTVEVGLDGTNVVTGVTITGYSLEAAYFGP